MKMSKMSTKYIRLKLTIFQLFAQRDQISLLTFAKDQNQKGTVNEHRQTITCTRLWSLSKRFSDVFRPVRLFIDSESSQMTIKIP